MSVRTWMLDSLHARTEGKGSWRFDFTEAFEVKEGEVVQVDDVTFQHSFPTLDENSQRLYVVYQHGVTVHGEILNLPIGVYNATQIKDELENTLNAGYRWNGSNSQFVATITNGIISVAVNQIPTGPDLSGKWRVFNGADEPQREETVTKVNSMQFTYDQGGVRSWEVDDDFDNTIPRQFTLTETRADGSTQVYTWDDATQRLNGGGGFYFKRAAGHVQQFQTTEQFYIVDEHTVRAQSFHFVFQNRFTGPNYDIHNTKSANSLLGHTKYHPSGEMTPMLSTQTLGHCNPASHKNSIYLHCPQISGLDVRGPAPHSSSCVAVLHLMGSTYGDIDAQSTYREHRYVTPPHGVISFMVFSLRDAANHELDMKGLRLTMVLSVVKKR